ncbi:galactose mutarotase-like protein [Moniliophthora roreri]|nr:galactose mutarotase-like protein [Moniliophthora roreri]
MTGRDVKGGSKHPTVENGELLFVPSSIQYYDKRKLKLIFTGGEFKLALVRLGEKLGQDVGAVVQPGHFGGRGARRVGWWLQ